MGFCKDCGAEVPVGANVCGSCGSVIGSPGGSAPNLSKEPFQTSSYSQNVSYDMPPSYSQSSSYDNPPAAEDKGGFLWGLLGCCIPIVGLVLFLVWKDTKPSSAKAAGIGALVSVVLSAIFYAVSFAIGAGAGVLG